jgi:hypothetical protein
MRVQVYTAYPFALTVSVSTPWEEGNFSTKFPNGKLHEEIAARVCSVLREHKHLNDSHAAEYPAAKRLQTYFPTLNSDASQPLYAIRELKPAGSPRDNTPDFEIMRIRFMGLLVMTKWAFIADEEIAEGRERNMQYAVKQLFAANNLPNAFIPGDETMRPGEGTEIDILCEIGPASERGAMDIPAPS